MSVERLLGQLEGVKRGQRGWRARCPSHGSPANRSLSVSETSDGIVLIRCHAGCDTEQVLSELGLAFSDLYPKTRLATRLRPVRRGEMPVRTARETLQATRTHLLEVWVHLVTLRAGKPISRAALDQSIDALSAAFREVADA